MPAKKRKSVPRAPQDEAPSLVALHGGYCGLERLSVLPCSHGWQTAEPERDPEGRPGVYTQEDFLPGESHGQSTLVGYSA